MTEIDEKILEAAAKKFPFVRSKAGRAAIAAYLNEECEPNYREKTMKFTIGTWKTRDGRKAVVEKITDLRIYPLRGRVIGGNDKETWTLEGKVHVLENIDSDLIGPWEEPTTKEETSYGKLLKQWAHEEWPQEIPEKILRDLFASFALAGILVRDIQDLDWKPRAARNAYRLADAMMEARKK